MSGLSNRPTRAARPGRLACDASGNVSIAFALAAVASAKVFIAANPSDANALAAGLAQGAKAFEVNADTIPFAPVPAVQAIASAPPAASNCAAQTACLYLSRSKQTFAATMTHATAT